ncbi:hypothetical protein BGU01_15780 [Clostridioides difficile]|nr:hypothetical protein BGU01_15780 [Clostridioides difficile]
MFLLVDTEQIQISTRVRASAASDVYKINVIYAILYIISKLHKNIKLTNRRIYGKIHNKIKK